MLSFIIGLSIGLLVWFVAHIDYSSHKYISESIEESYKRTIDFLQAEIRQRDKEIKKLNRSKTNNPCQIINNKR